MPRMGVSLEHIGCRETRKGPAHSSTSSAEAQVGDSPAPDLVRDAELSEYSGGSYVRLRRRGRGKGLIVT